MADYPHTSHATIAQVGRHTLPERLELKCATFNTGSEHACLFSHNSLSSIFWRREIKRVRRNFLLSSSLICLCPASQVCSVFRTRNLPSSHDGNPEGMTIVCMLLDAWGSLLHQYNLWRDLSCLALRFSLNNQVLWEQYRAPMKGTSYWMDFTLL